MKFFPRGHFKTSTVRLVNSKLNTRVKLLIDSIISIKNVAATLDDVNGIG